MNKTGAGLGSIIDVIINKLTPKVLGLLVAMGMLLLAIIIGIAVFQDKDVDLFGIKISQPSRECQEELARCQQELAQSLPLSQLQEIIGKPLAHPQVVDTLRALVKFAGEAAEWRNNFNYRLFELEQQLHRFGGFISTRIQDASRTAAYRMIQGVLSEVGFYSGVLNGEQKATYDALVAFQKDYNQQVAENEQITSLGSFGYRTLEALRSRYRLGRE
ncbi:MAG TPA: hypothetical protein PLN61_07165 [bacterium]|nr:hypothetical protein [bacterium]HQI48431.1 hypothetical protein [bacterium]HQJ65894.1 hypothetical protein [bacterium]